MKQGQVMRWFFGPMLLFLVACRIRIRLANCLTMLAWDIEVGHGAEGPLRSGCINEIASSSSTSSTTTSKNADGTASSSAFSKFTDVSDITITPMELEDMLSSEQQDNKNNHHNIMQGGGIGNTSIIPRIFHQSYISTRIHSAIYPFVQSWHDGLAASYANPKWKFVWWSDDDLRWLVHTHYPDYINVWEGLPHTIMRTDTARYFILHRYGGLYADIDIEYLHLTSNNNNNNNINNNHRTSETISIEDWFHQHARDLSKEEPYNAYMFHECADNSMMASARNATFWPLVFAEWTAAARNPFLQTVNRISGIDMLKDMCRKAPLADPTVHLATPDNRQFAYHHGTNSWRWKTKRDDFVRIFDVVILVHLSIAVLLCGLSHYLQVDIVRWIFCKKQPRKTIMRYV